MSSKPTLLERRKHRRFKVTDSAFALCHPNSKTPCRIMNISKGGLAFCYALGEKVLNDSEELDIFCCDTDFCLIDIPFETVCDCVLADADPAAGTAIHRRGIKFGILNPEQQVQLEYFIDSTTRVVEEA